MDTTHFVRDPERVRKACREANDGSVVAVKPTKIVIPERFIEKQLAEIGAETYIVGIWAQVVEDKYFAVFLGTAMFHVEPTSIATVKYDGDSYLELSFDPGARILVSQEVVQDRLITYRIYDEVISKGHMPWYLGYDDRIRLLFTADKLAGVGMLSNHAMLELNAAAISRDPDNIARYYRHFVQDFKDLEQHPPLTIPLMSVSYGTTNTTSRLLGSYFEQGLNSSLVNPSTQVENIERLLRA
jgi:hypothetical protein